MPSWLSFVFFQLKNELSPYYPWVPCLLLASLIHGLRSFLFSFAPVKDCYLNLRRRFYVHVWIGWDKCTWRWTTTSTVLWESNKLNKQVTSGQDITITFLTSFFSLNSFFSIFFSSFNLSRSYKQEGQRFNSQLFKWSWIFITSGKHTCMSHLLFPLRFDCSDHHLLLFFLLFFL